MIIIFGYLEGTQVEDKQRWSDLFQGWEKWDEQAGIREAKFMQSEKETSYT